MKSLLYFFLLLGLLSCERVVMNPETITLNYGQQKTIELNGQRLTLKFSDVVDKRNNCAGGNCGFPVFTPDYHESAIVYLLATHNQKTDTLALWGGTNRELPAREALLNQALVGVTKRPSALKYSNITIGLALLTPFPKLNQTINKYDYVATLYVK